MLEQKKKEEIVTIEKAKVGQRSEKKGRGGQEIGKTQWDKREKNMKEFETEMWGTKEWNVAQTQRLRNEVLLSYRFITGI